MKNEITDKESMKGFELARVEGPGIRIKTKGYDEWFNLESYKSSGHLESFCILVNAAHSARVRGLVEALEKALHILCEETEVCWSADCHDPLCIEARMKITPIREALAAHRKEAGE